MTAVPAAQPKADTDDITEAAGTVQVFYSGGIIFRLCSAGI
jgi:hypothetical protein